MTEYRKLKLKDIDGGEIPNTDVTAKDLSWQRWAVLGGLALLVLMIAKQ